MKMTTTTLTRQPHQLHQLARRVRARRPPRSLVRHRRQLPKVCRYFVLKILTHFSDSEESELKGVVVVVKSNLVTQQEFEGQGTHGRAIGR